MVIQRGPAAVRAALVEAAADLFAAQGNASVRAVARRAGVNHGLVHHYLGSKRGLRAAVLDRLSASIYADLGPPAGAGLRALASAALERTDSDPRFVKILARALLDGELPEQLQSAFPVVEGLRLAAGDNSLEVRAALAEGLALSLGLSVFAPWIAAALGLEQRELEQVREAALERLYATLEHAGNSDPAGSEEEEREWTTARRSR